MKSKILLSFLFTILLGLAFGSTAYAKCANVHCDRGFMLCNGNAQTAAACRQAGRCTANSWLGDCKGVGVITCPNKSNGSCTN